MTKTLKPHQVNKIRGPLQTAREHGERMANKLRHVRTIMTEMQLDLGQVNYTLTRLQIAQSELNYLDTLITRMDENLEVST